MTAIELITALESFPPGAKVMLNMTTAEMDQFKFVSIHFVDEVYAHGDDTDAVVLISHTDPGQEEEDFSLN